MAQDDVLIRFVDVHKSFGAQAVLRGVDFEVRRGRTLGIMGGSGTGKSVTLRHVIGLLKPDRGLVEVDGHDMSRVTPKELAALRKRMGYVFQEAALINWLTVYENLALPLRENSELSAAEIDARVREKLEWVQIPDAGGKLPSEISGGMKKRVGLARALITDPEIVLFDEPNAGLDPEISGAINKLIRELSLRLGITALAVEHRVGCLKTIADEVLFLHEGRVLVHEPTEEFFRPKHPRLVQFLGDELVSHDPAPEQRKPGKRP